GLVKEVNLADLAPGSFVALTMSADEKTVEVIMAQGPMIRGVLKSVDAGKNSLTVNLSGGGRRGEEAADEEKTYQVATDAEIGMDDGRGRRLSFKEAKLGELVVGSIVTLFLSVDQKHAQSVMAEGPAHHGIVKAIDAGKRTLTLAPPAG